MDGDDYVISGSKIGLAAERADHIFPFVRTDPDAKPQLGISFLLAKMDVPGIVKPLLAFNGKRLWNQVFFDHRVPRENRLAKRTRGGQLPKTCSAMTKEVPVLLKIVAFSLTSWRRWTIFNSIHFRISSLS